jgi:protein TonB
MFEQAILSNGRPAKRVWTTCLGITGQAFVVTAMILTPMIWPQVLPKAQTFLVGPLLAPPLPPGPVVRPRPPQGSPRRPSEIRYAILREPTRIPTHVLITDEPAGPSVDNIIGIPDRGPQGIMGALFGGALVIDGAPAPPPRAVETVKEIPKAPPPTVIPRIIKVSQLDSARLLHRVEPVYPRMAIQVRVSGTVELRGVVATDGHIRELKVLRGHPLLIKAALDAVRQWIYEPTRLNGEAVEVDAPILVTFHLN